MLNRSKKMLGLMLALVMLISLFPGVALARDMEEEQLYAQTAAAEQRIEGVADIQPRSGPITVTNETQLRDAIAAGNSPITINNTISLTRSLFVHPSTSRGNFTLQGTGRLNVTGFFRHINIHQNRHVTLGGSLTFARPAGATVNGGGIALHESATLTMNGGTITGNQGYVFGGGVDVSNGTFHFNGGTIHTNGATDGGGVFIGSNSRFVMRGGVIRNNVASSTGGGLSTRGVSQMINGEIHNNNVTSATGGGGGVSISSISAPNASFTMDGGAIRNNTADRGAGMRITSATSGATTVTINNGEIHSNTAVRNGGGIWVTDTAATTTTFTMHNGAIRHNRAGANTDGGGMHIGVSGSSTVRINGGEIRNNTAGRHGGGIHTTNYTMLRTAAAVRFSANSAGARHDFGAENRGANVNVTRGGSGNPQHILWASVSRAGTHVLNNYDVNFTHSNIITFNLNGGTGNFPQQVLRDGQTATEPTAIPVRAGHTFRGWFTSATGSTRFNFGNPITASATVHAQWTAYPVVTFNLHGGSGNIPPQTMSGRSGTVTEPVTNPTREGHTFDGWFTTATGNTRFNFSNTITANTTIHARWVPYRTVTFNLHGGSGDFPTQTVPNGTIITEPVVIPTRERHTFSGWFTTETGTTRFNFSAPTTANRTAHAQWIPYRTVTFNLHGGTGTFPTQTVPNGTIIAEPSVNPTRDGYTFVGWFTTATGTTRFNFASPTTANRTAHARWTPALPTDRTVTFNLHGGTGSFPLTQTVPDGGTATAPATNPTRPGYTFAGWYTAATGGVRFHFSTPITADTNIHARWTPVVVTNHTVTFNLHGGTGGFPLTQTVPDGGTIMEPATNPARPHFTFSGWYTAEHGGVRFDFSSLIIANTTIHARWTPISYEFHPAFMIGNEYGYFAPGNNLTRAEAAVLLARVHLLDFEPHIAVLPPGMDTFDVFSDVSSADWFFYALAWAYDAGLIQGDAGRFNPHNQITREEFTALVVRTGTVFPVAGAMPFGDADTISSWAQRYVYTSYRERLVLGNDQGNFNPQGRMTRAEAATLMSRFLSRVDRWELLNAIDIEHFSEAHLFPDVYENAWYFPAVLAVSNDHYLLRTDEGVIVWKAIAR